MNHVTHPHLYEVVRYDRKGVPEYRRIVSTTEKNRLQTIYENAEKRQKEEDRVVLKTRQDSGELSMNEKLFVSIFGVIK